MSEETEFIEDSSFVNSVSFEGEMEDIRVYDVRTEFGEYRLITRSREAILKSYTLMNDDSSEVLCESDDIKYIVRAMKPVRRES